MSRTDADRLVGAALELGINHFDTANVYNQGESERLLGEALKSRSARLGCVLSSKFGYRMDPADLNSGGSSRRAMFRAVEGSLKRLGTDFLDLLYLHLWDARTSVDETLGAASDLLAQGKVRYFCLSNVPSWYLARAETTCEWRGWQAPASVQLNYNLLTRALEPEFFSFLQTSAMGLVAWGPLANGLLTGRYRVDAEKRRIEGSGRLTETFCTGHVDPYDERVQDVLRRLAQLSESTGHSQSALAIAWVLRRTEVSSVLLGVSSVDQLFENAQALGVVLSDDDWAGVETASECPRPVPYGFLDEQLLEDLVYGTDKFGRATDNSGR